MRIIVINPPNIPHSEKSLLIEPIDALGIATCVKALGHKVQFVDMDIDRLYPESLEKTIQMFQPEVAIIPFDYHIPLHTTEAVTYTNMLGNIMHKYRIKAIVGGKTAKYHPDEFLGKGIDVVINGEMEPVLLELLEIDGWSNKNMRKIDGISYLDKGNIKKTADRCAKIDLDALPTTDRSMAHIGKYIDVRSMLTSRGCFGKCSFCPIPDFWGQWRWRSPEKVVDEIEYLVNKYNAKKILFLDDNATVNKERMKQIAQEIIDRQIDTRLGCLGTVQTYDRDTMRQMYQAGFRWIHYGGESGNAEILKKHGKNVTPTQIKQAILESKEIGFRVRTSWILDLPGVNQQALQDTIDLILETEPDEIRAHYLALRAGTRLYDEEFDLQGIPSQYIHDAQPRLNLSGGDQDTNRRMIGELTNELQQRGYLVIKDVKAWRDVPALKEKNPELKFISFCPARYGLNWEKQ